MLELEFGAQPEVARLMVVEAEVLAAEVVIAPA
jgi:hypothetical protein